MVECTVERFGGIDVLVCNAGISMWVGEAGFVQGASCNRKWPCITYSPSRLRYFGVSFITLPPNPYPAQ